MKKILTWFSILLLSLLIVACSSKDEEATNQTADDQEQTEQTEQNDANEGNNEDTTEIGEDLPD